MKVSNRPFDPESSDFKRLCQFVIQDNRVKKENFVWQLGRMVDWKYGLWQEQKYFPTFFTRNAQLWLDYWDEIVGFAISENSDNSFHIFLKDAYAYLYEEIVRWVVEHWADRQGGLCTELAETQAAQARTLEKHGFVARGITEVTRAYALDQMQISLPALENGFQLVDMAMHPDPVGLAKLKADAFRGQSSVSSLDLLTHAYVRESPIYRPEFDLSILNAQGEYVAGCEAFIDAENNVAEIERVCVHSAYRRRGLAKAVIMACFHRLRGRGISTAYITGMSAEAISLYGKMEHAKEIPRISYTLSASKTGTHLSTEAV